MVLLIFKSVMSCILPFSETVQFNLDLVGNPEERFSRVAAHISLLYLLIYFAFVFPLKNAIAIELGDFPSFHEHLSCIMVRHAKQRSS